MRIIIIMMLMIKIDDGCCGLNGLDYVLKKIKGRGRVKLRVMVLMGT